MKRPSTKRLAALTLAGILVLGEGGYYVYSRFIQPSENQPDPVALQAEICELKKRASELEDQAIGYELETLFYTEQVAEDTKCLEAEVQDLREKNAGLARKVSELRVMNDKQDANVDELTIKQTRLQRKFKKLYANSAVNQDYPVDTIVQLMDEAKLTYDRQKFEEAAARFSPLERQGFFLALLDENQLHSSYDQRKKDRYNDFFRNGMTDADKNRVLKELGIRSNSLNQRYSPLSLAVFEVYEIAKTLSPIPPFR